MSVARKSAKPLALVEKTAPPPRSPRRPPQERIDQLLDVAAQLLMEDGFTQVSMERLGREAGVSKALVYKYFPNRNDVLCALLAREHQRVRAMAVQAAKQTHSDFRELLRSTTKVGIENRQRRGALLSKLWAEPAVVRSLADNIRRVHDEDVAYFAHKVNKLYGIPLDVAEATVNMQMAMTGAAAQHFADGRKDADAVTELCVTMILGSLEALRPQAAPVTTLARVPDAEVVDAESPTRAELLAEVARLREALERAETERDVVKKAAAYFAADSLQGRNSA